MMKRVLIFVVIFSLLQFIQSCSKVPQSPIPVSRPIVPVFEVFVYARCPNCPVVENILDSLKENYGDSVVVLEYHIRVLGDTISPASIYERQEFYSVGNQAPITIVHGEENIQGNQSVNYTLFNNYYKTIKSTREDSLFLSVSINDLLGDSLGVTINADTLLNLSGAKVFICVSEDSIYFAQSGAPDSLFKNVVRFYYSAEPVFPLKIKIPRFQRNVNFVVLVQDTLSKKIRGVTQRRL
ncbi:MAG: hypothetical protein ABIL92_03420 [candidate division WOR-3 bacterium]